MRIDQNPPLPEKDAGNDQHAACTLLTASKPRIVTKEFRLKPDGALHKQTTAHVTAGKMEIIYFSNLSEFADLLKGLQTNQCFLYGVPLHSPVELVAEKEWAMNGYPDSQIARTNKTMNWPAGPGIMMLDYDAPKDGKSVLSQEQLINALCDAYPELMSCDILWWPSTSSCIYHKDKELTGIRGQRFYLLVKDARDISRAGKAILVKLWAKGYGYFEVSKSGSLLERGLFDASVWQSSRIDFAAGAKCHGDLEQRRGEPVLIEGLFGESLDSINVIDDPTPEEIALAEKNKSQQKALVFEEAVHVRENWK